MIPIFRVSGDGRIDLNGEWALVLDRHAAEDRFALADRKGFEANKFPRHIDVPRALDEVYEDFEGVAFYAFVLDVAAGVGERDFILEFEAVNYRAECFVNGHAVDFHDGGYNPFSFDITDFVRPGENFVVVRVITPQIQSAREIEGIGRDGSPHQRGAITGGIWRPVALNCVSKVRVDGIFVHADADGCARVQVDLANSLHATADTHVNVEIRFDGRPVASASMEISVPPGGAGHTFEISIPAARAWSLEDPALYDCRVTLSAPGVTAVGIERFGCRSFTIEGRSFLLNGEPLFLAAAFWEALYPITLLRPTSLDLVRREIGLTKEAGFNMLRPWRLPLPRDVLDLCDEMGILVTAGLPVECMGEWPAATPQLAHRVGLEVEQLVRGARNHPSIVLWEIFNEIKRPEIGRLKTKMVRTTRDLDPSRLIFDESGGWWGGGAKAYAPGSRDPIKVSEYHIYLPGPTDPADEDYLVRIGGCVTGDRDEGVLQTVPDFAPLLYISEVGYGGLTDLDADVARYDHAKAYVTPDAAMYRRMRSALSDTLSRCGVEEEYTIQDFAAESQRTQAEANYRQVKALRANPAVSGYCLHALTCGSWVYGAGILDIWRDPKPTWETVKAANAHPPVILSAPAWDWYAEDEAPDIVLTAPDGVGPLHRSSSSPEVLAWSEEAGRWSASEEGTATLRIALADGTKVEQRDAFVACRPGERRAVVMFGHVPPNAELEKTADGDTVLVGCGPLSAADVNALGRRLENIRGAGGRAVFLNPPLARSPDLVVKLSKKYAIPPTEDEGLRRLFSEQLGLDLVSRLSDGHWTPAAHLARSGSWLFDGCPETRFLGELYGAVAPRETIIEGIDPYAAELFAILPEYKVPWRSYYGMYGFWTGASVIEVPYGNGSIVLSTLRLLGNGGRPIADRMIRNLCFH